MAEARVIDHGACDPCPRRSRRGGAPSVVREESRVAGGFVAAGTDEPRTPAVSYGAKYPLMSRITCVGFVT